jgi:hypothetical protein
MKVLVLGHNQDPIAVAQRDPFSDNCETLRQQLNLELTHITAETFVAIEEACQTHTANIVFLLPSWEETPEEAEQAVKSIRDGNSELKIYFIDPFSQVSTTYFNLLPYVDRLLKRQRYKNLEDYKKSYVGGTMFTDYLASKWHLDLNGWHVGSKIPIGYEERIISGWNLGTSKNFRNILLDQSPSGRRSHTKNIDVFCRLSLGSQAKKEWYYKYRVAALQSVKALESRCTVAASGGFIEAGLVSRFQYYRELVRSRIVFSPFGWGENCWRDFEAICYDCLLIKPSMAHIDTQPNIFIEGETYVSVRWDFADLEEKCRYYLEHPDEAAHIIENARRVCTAYFKQNEFVKAIQQLISDGNSTSSQNN